MDTDDDTAAWLTERQAAREAQHDRRRAWLDQANAERKEARTHGLRIRHATKLARLQQQSTAAAPDDAPEEP